MAHNQDWLEWLLSLNANAVEYVIVGGVALAHHGLPRYTGIRGRSPIQDNLTPVSRTAAAYPPPIRRRFPRR